MEEFRNCKILIVDDTKTNIDVLIQALGADYKLAVALDGRAALDIVRAAAVDLILLDIMMPEMDGFEVCRRLKADETACEIPVIFITAMNAPGEKTRGFEIGAVDYITKPFDILEVKARVKTHLHLKLSQETLKDQNQHLEKRVAERTRELVNTQIEILQRLGMAAEKRDNETGQHIKRMSEFCRLLGRQVGLSRAEADHLALASTMHDIGKIGIPDPILLKKGKLTDSEFEKMKTHTDLGAGILTGSKSRLLKSAEIICRTHHEKWDGTGYPDGLKGEQIPLIGRIACLCDVFDAIISKRPYKPAWSMEKAMAHIRSCSGTHFDPQLVELFVSIEQEIIGAVKTFGTG